jgi:hypothetical protein
MLALNITGLLQFHPRGKLKMMANLDGIVKKLKQEHDRLSKQLLGISAALSAFGTAYKRGNGSGSISAAGRARIAAAQRARWAKVKGKAGQKTTPTPKKRRVMSAAAKKRIGDAQRARWAKLKKAA